MNTQSESSPAPDVAADDGYTRCDVRPIACHRKHELIFQRWAALVPGGHFVMINDYDLLPLYYQFASQFPGAFEWEYLVSGPDEFHVKITRLKAAPETVRRPALPSWPPRGNQVAVASPAAKTKTAAGESEVDARGLEPPEPMLRILSALVALPVGGVLSARTDRRPIHLLPELEARGVRHESTEQIDGSWITTLRRA